MEYRILKSEEMEKAFALREEVFVDEQKVPLEYEVDDRDSLEDTIHVGVFEGDDLLATARIMNINKDIVYFGRACVKKSCRGKGVGKFLFISMEETVKKFKKENEKNIPASQPPSREQAWFPRENGNKEWPPCVSFTSCSW